MFKLERGGPNRYKVYLENGERYKDKDGDDVDIILVERKQNEWVILDEDEIPYAVVYKLKGYPWTAVVSTRAAYAYGEGKSRMKALENALNKLPYWHAGRYEWWSKPTNWYKKKDERQIQRAWELSAKEFGIKL